MSRGQRIFTKKEKPIEICPYQFRTCKKPADKTCSIREQLEGVEDIGKWARISHKAPYCKYTGIQLTMAQYHNRRIGAVIQEGEHEHKGRL